MGLKFWEYVQLKVPICHLLYVLTIEKSTAFA